MVWILILCLVFCSVYLFLLKTQRASEQKMKAYKNVYIAHRGLFNEKEDIPENSLPAFKRAVEAGYGVELDVQLTIDKKLVVFHDSTLERMCSVNKKLTDCTYEELCEYSLVGTSEKIPLFSDVLSVIGGKVPLIVEIKTEGAYEELCEHSAKMLDCYNGEYCIESFNPFAVRWFKENRPEVVRGQLATDYFADNVNKSFIEKFVLTNMFLNQYTRPDFIAYNHKHTNAFSYRVCRKVFNPVNVAWTIKTQKELETAKKVYDVIIFDSFIPEN